MIEAGQPLVTFALFAYNQEQYIGDAVEAALAQDYAPLEIILSDDCSSDETFELIKKFAASYAGPHKIVVRRNTVNVGLAEHINQICRLATGSLIIAAAGDDVSHVSRARILVNSWLQHGKPACSLFSEMIEINQKSERTGKFYHSLRPWSRIKPEDMVKRNIGVFGAAHAWSADVMKKFPPMHGSVINEDHVIPFRAAMLGGIFFVNEPLVKYRANIGLASNFSTGQTPSKLERRHPRLLRRPYLVYVQKTADIRWIGLDNSNIFGIAKSRRADHLFRYWLSARKKFTKKRYQFFIRRCRIAWLIRELLLNVYLRFNHIS